MKVRQVYIALPEPIRVVEWGNTSVGAVDPETARVIHGHMRRLPSAPLGVVTILDRFIMEDGSERSIAEMSDVEMLNGLRLASRVGKELGGIGFTVRY